MGQHAKMGQFEPRVLAQQLIGDYGGNASAQAILTAGDLLDMGDTRGFQYWLQVAAEVNHQQTIPRKKERPN